MRSSPILDGYCDALAEHLCGQPGEVALLHAYELGRRLVEQGVGLLEVVRLHMQALGRLELDQRLTVTRDREEAFLTEVLGPFEMAYLGFREANVSLRALTAELEEQVDDRTRELQRSLSELQTLDADRRRLLARLVSAQEDERHRLADDLHDDTIQVLTAAGMRLDGLRRWVDHEGEPALDRIETTILAAIGRLRRLVFELRPPALDREGLGAAVQAYVGETFEGVDVAIIDRLAEQPPVATREVLYRIVQEALANVRKHAQAVHVEVMIEAHRHGVQVRVRDDGCGFDPRRLEGPRPGHLGASAMRERAEMVGGRCTIASVPGEGTEVSCWVPTSVGPGTTSSGSRGAR